MPANILIIDDRQSILEILQTALGEQDYVIATASSGSGAIEKLSAEEFDLLLCDVRLPDVDGLQVLKSAVRKSPRPAVVMMTAYGSIENAIECMKLGADDYVTKPFNLDEIRQVVIKVLDKVALERENLRLRAELGMRYDFSGIIGKSKQMLTVFDMIRRIAPSSASVLITGETGVGKELVARATHYNSPRAHKTFVALNCAAIPENLLESELFGHVKGAFTGAVANKRGIFEEADGSTLLLDEIAEMHPALQAKLLRTLDDGSVRRVGDNHNIPINVRLICSTNRDLELEVKSSRFRLDLYHRIKVVEINIPPLRERREDIALLIDFYLKKLNAEHKRNITGFTPEAMAHLLSNPWYGNARELINILEQAVLLSDSEVITAGQLPALSPQMRSTAMMDDLIHDESLKAMLDRVEKEIIIRILEQNGGNRRETAKRLGLSDRALYYKLDEHGIK